MIYDLRVNFYRKQINERFQSPANVGKPEETNAVGTGASFVCGSFVRFYLEINLQSKKIETAKFKSNGCGFVIAAADVLAEKIVGRKLTEIHGLEELRTEIELEIGKFDAHRKHCLEICLDAVHQAFSNFRALQIEEFIGEKALICTCFGVSEETIKRVIAENYIETVEEIGEICNAGKGCGSCQMLVAELLDAKDDIFKR
jgi:NifU-like protein